MADQSVADFKMDRLYGGTKGDPVDFEHWDVTLENYTGSELVFHWGKARLMYWN